MATASFHALTFGYAQAEVESARDPRLLLEGYLDQYRLEHNILRGPRWLVLGHKGSGKSAIREHLRLKLQSSPTDFLTSAFVSDFPFQDFSSLTGVAREQAAGLVSGWTWLLLLQIMDSLSRDNSLGMNPELATTLRVLKDESLLPAGTLRESVFRSSKRTLKLVLPGLSAEHEWTASSGNMRLTAAVEALRRIAVTARPASRHLIAIDGLDEVFIQPPVPFDSLAALVLAANRLNNTFESERSTIKIVVLCRTDLFERLPGANKNKIRQDAAVELDWYQDPKEPGHVNLVALATTKARVSYPAINDVFDLFFPSHMILGQRRRQTLANLLLHTRHTPRDFLQLLAYIQKVAPKQGRLNEHAIRTGVRDYCIKYFVGEIRDEIEGYLGGDDIRRVLRMLGMLWQDTFMLADLETKIQNDSTFASLDLKAVLELLFDAGAIGTKLDRAGDPSFYTFSFRNRHSGIDLSRTIVVHPALALALNVRRRSSRDGAQFVYGTDYPV
jgi:hypothetical protein